jgi:demethylmenaquinone methyltransferase / 2-methoxy-6-polyprenyl-1,4-benzoquinol methylase
MNNKEINEYTRVKPYDEEEEKTRQLSRMFNTISGKYDKFNDIMTWGLARNWRKSALLSLKPLNPVRILDIATGTGDFGIKAFRYLHPETIIGVDISDKMMEIGQEKVRKAGLEGKMVFEVQDCALLPYSDNSFDAATIAFGIRNFEKLNESLLQIYRVLRTGGQLLILEMNEPQKGILSHGYQLYTKVFVKLTSRILSADSRAYDYLTTSMHVFPNGKKLLEILEQNGFKIKKHRRFTFGVCSMYLVEKS